jgi:hypothetical protein
MGWLCGLKASTVPRREPRYITAGRDRRKPGLATSTLVYAIVWAAIVVGLVYLIAWQL